ncbi:MAG: DNA repair protein RecO [Candidatus Kuenenia sp.]|nr:DNA repair protein RecO [Candidatus Kuenenia hertensis]
MSIVKTDAITLGRTDYSDSSQIIIFYTRDYGKIHTIAKGFKRTSGKYNSKAIDLLTHYRILFIKKEHSTLHTLTDAVLQNNYPLFRNDLDKYFKASYVAELVNEFTEKNDPNELLFDLFLNTLNHIAAGTNTIIWLLAFELKMLNILGYLPEWERCICCKKRIQHQGRVSFNAVEGGARCVKCNGELKDGVVVSAGTMLIAGRLSNLNFQRLERVRVQLSICVEIEKVLRYYIISVLKKELNSWKYVTFST